MVFFGRKTESTEAAEPSLAQRVKAQTAQEIATADVTELVNNMTRDCFALCFDTPGSSVSTYEAKCTQNCAKKFMAAWNVTSRVYVSRLQQ